jgi:7,8-dihydro-6-hydroxymethylpterin dimethyltransferase
MKGKLEPLPSRQASASPMGLPRTEDSICPECFQVIPATLTEEAGRVIMRKTCPTHGPFEDVVSASAALFLRLERYAKDGSVAFENPVVEDSETCPHGCGLCAGHRSHAAMTNLDLTNRCNLRCPYCFANAAVQPYVYEPDLEKIREMIDRALELRPKRMQAVQFSGGEPTLSPHFLEACRLVKARGINMIQVATNGIRFAQEEGFAERAAAAGLNAAYLQFDGVDDEVYRATRGVKGLWEIKLAAMEAFRRAGIRVTLVPTMIKGVNDHQLGDILRFAIANLDVVVGVAPQPVSFTGRIDQSERLARRYTSGDVALDIERQTGLLVAERDWWPFSITVPFASIAEHVMGRDGSGFLPMHCSAHPDCGLSAFLLINTRTGAAVPLNELFDIDETIRLVDDLARKTGENPSRLYASAKFFSILMKTYRPEKAPPGLGVVQLAKTIDAISGKRILGIAKKKRYEWRLLLIASMHFMDAYNYQVERVKRCTIHYSSPDGRIYPFCTYNSGHAFRQQVEREHSVPKEEWLASRGGRFVSEGFLE